jgi:hypothetical protein
MNLCKRLLCSAHIIFSIMLCSFLVAGQPASAAAQAQSEEAPGIQAMKLVANQSGWLLANDRLFWTTSLGAQWTEITPPAPAGTGILGIFFNPAGSGWVMQSSSDQTTFTIARTSDRGGHWTSTSIDSPFNDGLPFGGNAFLYFADDQHGWLMLSVQSSSNSRRGVLFQTSDGGTHWTRLPDPPVGGDMIFSDSQHGFMGPGPRGDELFSTSDAGNTWQPVVLATPATDLAQASSNITLPFFTDTIHGILLRTYSGSAVVRYETSDSGASWTPTAPVRSSQPSIVALAADGTVTSQILPVRAAAISQGHAQFGAATHSPVRATFATTSQGWVLFASGSCDAIAATCTQTSSLQGTLDGGKTFFSLGDIPGVALQTTHTVTLTSPQSLNVTPSFSSNSVTPMATTSLPSASPLINQMGFDKCEILTTAQMQDWYTNSPYRAVGAYIGGISRACSNVGFTQAWGATVLAQGWGIIAIWVGPQAYNTTFAHKLSGIPATDQATGVTEADAAAAHMAILGFGPGSIVYYDMEAYTRTATSEASTQAFVEGWVSELHANGLLGAIYSSHPELQDWEPGKVVDAPDAIWFAYFYSTGVPCGTRCQNTESSDIPDTYWNNNQRIRQTSSGFTSTYGTTAASIDEDWADGPVVIISGNRITVALAGTGTGTITSSDTFISCGTVCSAVYPANATVTLTAAPTALSSFISWTGCTSSTGYTCTVTVAGASTVTATINITPPVFSITSSATSLTWSLGSSAGSNITVSSKAPYQGVFTFSCSGLPSYLQCAFTPATLTADGSGTPLVSVLTLTATSTIGQTNAPHNPRNRSMPIQLTFLLAPFLAAPLVFRRRLSAKGIHMDRLLLLLIAVLSLTLMQFATGCNNGSVKTTTTIFSGTIKLTATSAGTSQQLSIPVRLIQ